MSTTPPRIGRSPSPAIRLGLSIAALVLAALLSRGAGAAVYYSNEYASGVTMTGVASLNTTLDSTSSLTWTATFEYGLTSAYGTSIPGSTGANNVPPFYNGNVASVPISGLTCGTTYHWSVVVAGTYDNDQTFTTSPCPAPVLGVSPSSFAYGSVVVGESSPQTFTISNTGNADLVVSNITTSGAGAALFDVSLGTCGSMTPTLTASTSCTVVITFSPTSAGNKAAGLDVTSNAGTGSATLTGRGVASGGTVPTLSEWGTILLAAAFTAVLVLQSRRRVMGTPA